jgi:hypothetical protein
MSGPSLDSAVSRRTWAFPPASYLFDLAGYLQMRHERVIVTPPFGRAGEARLVDIAARLNVGHDQGNEDYDTYVACGREVHLLYYSKDLDGLTKMDHTPE